MSKVCKLSRNIERCISVDCSCGDAGARARGYCCARARETHHALPTRRDHALEGQPADSGLAVHILDVAMQMFILVRFHNAHFLLALAVVSSPSRMGLNTVMQHLPTIDCVCH